jgi:hypothetical protein
MPAPNLGLTRLLTQFVYQGTGGYVHSQEAVVLCGMNDCGQRGIEGTAQAQREEAHSSCGQGRRAAGARVGAARVGAA